MLDLPSFVRIEEGRPRLMFNVCFNELYKQTKGIGHLVNYHSQIFLENHYSSIIFYLSITDRTNFSEPLSAECPKYKT